MWSGREAKMGYQESFIKIGISKKRFDKVLNRILELSEEYYDNHWNTIVGIVTFNKAHYPFKKGEKAIFVAGQRWEQREASRLLGYVNEEKGILGYVEDAEEYEDYPNARELMEKDGFKGVETWFVENIDPRGIFEGDPVVTCEDFPWPDRAEAAPKVG